MKKFGHIMSMDWKGDDVDADNLRVEPEDDAVAASAENKIKKLLDEIESLRKEKQEYLDGWQRSKADYVNLLKRSEEEARGQRERGLMEAVEALLPAFDALERAKAHGEVPEGFLAIAKQLEGAFAELGLKSVGAVGERFDPAKHEALGQDETALCEEDDAITSVLESGWVIGDKVIRPAKVRVAHYKQP